MRNTTQRSVLQALALYLFWLKTGLSQERIALFFGIESQQNVSHYCQQVRESLKECFVSDNLGVSQKSRNEWLYHNSEIVKELFEMNDTQMVT